MRNLSFEIWREEKTKRMESWAQKKVLNLFVFNVFLAFLLLLHSAGYFAPFFPITINIIVLFSLILMVVLLEAKSRSIFFVALLFWLLASLLKLLRVDVWAERTTIYSFEALFVGIILVIIEQLKRNLPKEQGYEKS